MSPFLMVTGTGSGQPGTGLSHTVCASSAGTRHQGCPGGAGSAPFEGLLNLPILAQMKLRPKNNNLLTSCFDRGQEKEGGKFLPS